MIGVAQGAVGVATTAITGSSSCFGRTQPRTGFGHCRVRCDMERYFTFFPSLNIPSLYNEALVMLPWTDCSTYSKYLTVSMLLNLYHLIELPDSYINFESCSETTIYAVNALENSCHYLIDSELSP